MDVTHCRSCKAPITWEVTTTCGKWTPRNMDGTSHWATCPDAAAWSRREPAPAKPLDTSPQLALPLG